MIAITYDKETNFVFQHFWRTEYFCLFNKETDEEKIIDNGGYSHDSLPNATYVGFTGTPIDATLEVFGKVVDAYTMSKSVRDGITVNIVYEGRSVKVSLDQDKVKLIEKYYEQCAEDGSTKYQIEESQKAVSSLEVIIGGDDRLTALAKDLINHYETRVDEKATVAGKAMIICMNRFIAYKLRKFKILEESSKKENYCYAY